MSEASDSKLENHTSVSQGQSLGRGETPNGTTATDREQLPEETSRAADTGEPLRVFISYRIDPDAPLASALKRLIEGAIDPQPEVFVSGDGGLRPSNLGFKRQLQVAAQSAHAFVAIISNASKEREWIFFEAGAAWGRDLIYAPVLVGATPDDLSSTIADYQAISSESKDEMYELVKKLAERVGASVKERFGQRYQSFSRTVSQYLNGNANGDSTVKSKDLFAAFDLANRGEIEKSNEIFDRLEAELKDSEDLCELKIHRLEAQKKPREFLPFLSMFDEALKNTSTFTYQMAMLTDNPLVRAKYLLKAIEIGHGNNAIHAMFEKSKLDFELGNEDRGTQTLLNTIKLESSQYSTSAAKLLVELTPTLTPLEKLLVYFAGLTGSDANGYEDIVEVARDIGWSALELYAATEFDKVYGTGSSANMRGAARESFELRSLAYESYAVSAKRGVSVARCNMARMIVGGSSAAAALVVLDEHTGPFDAADRGYPHSLRANLERELDAQREKENEILKKAQRQFMALWAFAQRTLRVSHLEAFQPSVQIECGGNAIAFDESGAHAVGIDDGNVDKLRLFGHNTFVYHSKKDVVFLQRKGDCVDALYLADYRKPRETQWPQFIRRQTNGEPQQGDSV